jgi:hypothetical protein
MPSFCSECGAPLSPGSRFCEQCGTGTNPETAPFIPLLELHEGLIGVSRTPAVMEVSDAELRVYRLPEYFSFEVEDLKNKLDDAYLAIPDDRDWKAIVTAWDWKAEPLITAIASSKEDLAKGLLVIRTGEIGTLLIERIESDTVWDLMTIDAGGKKRVFDLVGPVAWRAFSLLRAVIGDKVTCDE